MGRLLPYHVLMLRYVNSNIPINNALSHQRVVYLAEELDALLWDRAAFQQFSSTKVLYEIAAIANPGARGGPRTSINKIAVSRLGVISGQWLTSSQGRHKGWTRIS